MSKKKRFGISPALTRGLNETINVVENNAGVFRHVVLSLSRIELDPDNPRKLAIDLNDVRKGLQAQDPLLTQKQAELEKLKEMALTIESSGIINPIVVYKRGEFYRVVAGERRCLASLLAHKNEIEARVFNEKPQGFQLKLLQWIENTAREDLSLYERLENVADLIREYGQQNPSVLINATLLKNLTGLSLSQTTYYLSVLNAPVDVKTEIKNGRIRNLDKAALLASISTPEIRKEAIQACLNGCSLKEIRSIVSKQKSLSKLVFNTKSATQGRKTNQVNMGRTAHTTVIKTLVEAVIAKKTSWETQLQFEKIDWQDLRQVTKTFRHLIKLLEIETVN